MSDGMTPERWRQVTEAFHAALAREASARAGYLDQACAGDRPLREEIDAMLAAHADVAPVPAIPVDASLTHTPRLLSGTVIGPYRVTELIGAGGMGIVYRARDTRLKRDVAIKVLPQSLATDPDRLARFQREAEILATLNHPNIAGIYGLENANGVTALVMELVEGPTLADRVAQGAVPLDETLPIARQIAEALAAAHAHGIVHRDLKPANIKLRPDGAVKVLDFGLAKPMDSAVAGDALHAPKSIGPAAMTGVGVLVGTASYMAPEQVRGRPVDRGTDIWAFGCVLYEMLTGRRAFAGDEVGDILAAVLRDEVDWNALPEDLAPAVTALLKRCLDRDQRTRVGDVSVIRFVLDERMGTPAAARRQSGLMSRANISVIVPGVIVAALLAVLFRSASVQPTVSDQTSPMRLSTNVGADLWISDGGLGPSAVLSSDGKTLAFTGGQTLGDSPQLHIRPLNQLQATPLVGTAGAFLPFFSPDGRWVGFFAEGKLKKISVSGGAAVTLSDAPSPRGGFWDANGTIVFQPQTGPGPLMRVREDGGTPEVLFRPSPESLVRWPQLLPGSSAVLFTEHSTATSDNWETASVVAQPLPSGNPKVLVRGGFSGRYVSSGHLLYMHDGTMFAAPMDLERLELTGPAVPVVHDVSGAAGSGSVQFAVADSGTAVYLSGNGPSMMTPIQWVDVAGKTSPLRAMPADWSNPAFSPDGRTLAMDISDGTQSDIWTYDWALDTLRRVTFDRIDDRRPIWSPDGSRITFTSKRGDNLAFDLYWVRADEPEEPQRLTTAGANAYPGSWHPSGRFLAYEEAHAPHGTDLMILPMDGDEKKGWTPAKPYTFLATPFLEEDPQFSPDGRWIAYYSNESGRFEIYVRPFPGPGGKWQVSSAPAFDPTWSRAAKELLFLSMDDRLIMAAPFRTEGDLFRAEKPRVWSPLQIGLRPRGPSRDLDLHPDGKRFAVAAATPQDVAKLDHVVLIFSFFDELRRVAPSK